MSKQLKFVGAVLAAGFVVSTAWASQAASTTSVQGTITAIRVSSPNVMATPTLVFALSHMPATTCKDSSNFAISATTDSQVLNNYFAMLLEARSAGQQVVVEFDAGVCDALGYPRVKDVLVL